MQAIPIHQAKANLSKYIQQAKAGKTVYIGSYGKAEVKLVVVEPQPKKQQLWGSMKGIWISDEAWDKATEEVNKDFEDALDKLDDI